MSNRSRKTHGGQHYLAQFPHLVDIAEGPEGLVFVVMDRGKLGHMPEAVLDGVTYQPPPRSQLTWAQFGIPSSAAIEKAFSNPESPHMLLDSVVRFLEPLTALPAPVYAYFLGIWVMSTYLSDQPGIRRSGIVNLFGDKERGKSRTLTGLGSLVYRANLTETVNEAMLFRFADYFGGTLLLDVSDFWPQVQKRGAEDFFLCRFEKGRTVHRVNRPDAEPFKDMDHYEVFGPTAIATNHLAPSKLLSRCFPISMPLKPGLYPEPDLQCGLILKERFLAFRAHMLAQALPEPSVIGSGRWQDISAPLTQIASLMGHEVLNVLRVALEDMERGRANQERESVEAQVVRCLIENQARVTGGRLETKLIIKEVNVGFSERFQVSPQKIGRVLSSFGFTKTKNARHIYWDQRLVDSLGQQYGMK